MDRPRINHRAPEFWEMAIIVDGKESTMEIFTNELDLDRAVVDLRNEYRHSAEQVELFITHHRHVLKIDCEQVCGDPDAHPDYTFGGEEQ